MNSLKEHWKFVNGRKMSPKRAFSSESEAQDMIDLMGDKLMHPYLCSICGKWHIGH